MGCAKSSGILEGMSENPLTRISAGIHAVDHPSSSCIATPLGIAFPQKDRPSRATIRADAVLLKRSAWGQKYSPR